MSTFWILVALMTLFALLFVIPPLLRNRERQVVDRDLLNAEVIKDQLAELRNDLETGKLDKDAYDAASRDLKRELLDDLEQNTIPGETGTRSGRWAAVLLLLLVPALALPLYQMLGTPQLINRLASNATATQPDGGKHQGDMSLENMVGKLAERMRAEPDNAEGWIMLGRSYASLGRYQEAADAYANAYQLVNDNPRLMTDYADVLATANQGVFSDQAGELLNKSLAMNPQDLKTLWLTGHFNFQRGKYAEAIGYWQTAASFLPQGDENATILEQQIELAQGKLVAGGGAPVAALATTGEPPSDNTTSGSQITVQVALDPGLTAQANGEDTVFIFARAVQGPKMPLAIVRKQVKDLPLTVTLNDSMAMTPAMVLSNFSEVTVGARVSKSGQAIPRSGDLQGMMSPVATGKDSSVEVIINQTVP
jgi:cytochrome c-type biogenesis protein CcmH